MPLNLTQKILSAHSTKADAAVPGEMLKIKFDQVLTHDINAVMCCLAFEKLGVKRVKPEVAVSYLDHNLLYIDSKTPDDHAFLQSFARHYGMWLSRPGNGIMHSVHLARFAIPGKTSIGTDSHTPTCGALGMFSIGGGGMDCAAAMAGISMRIAMPKVIGVCLTGKLRPGVGAKDVVLELLRRCSVKGGRGKVFEYYGPGVKTLTVPERATIANMGAETGATTSIFPSDENAEMFLAAQGRKNDYIPLAADDDCRYDESMAIDLSALEPLIACPNQPDNVMPIREIEKAAVQQVFIGSCTNGSYTDIAKAALVLRGHHINENTGCVCAIATRQDFIQLLKDGYLEILLKAGVRLTEISCGGCCGIGQTPATNAVSVRTSNRNFSGRSGNPTAKLYLVSPESAAATAVLGRFATAEELMGDSVATLSDVTMPIEYPIDDSMLLPPLAPELADSIAPIRGPNIKELPIPDPLIGDLNCAVSLKCRDDVTTDDITPASAEFSSMRSNIPAMSKYCFHNYDAGFAQRAKECRQSIIVAGHNYGQGSSREHAAINPMYLGVKAVIAKSISRIHQGNLINHGIIPLIFEDISSYDKIDIFDVLQIENIAQQLAGNRICVLNVTKETTFFCKTDISQDEISILISGGRLRYLRMSGL